MTDITKIDTTLHIGNFAIYQPVTFLTNCLITALCLYFYFQLNRSSLQNISTINWKRFFLLLGLASLLGGISHGFFAMHEGAGYKSFWLSMQTLNIFSVYRAQQATLFSSLRHSDKKYYWNMSYHTQLLLFFAAIFVFQNFLVVIIDTSVGLIPIMIIHFIEAKKVRESAWIAYGILILFLSAVVNAAKLSFCVYFNYQDIAHVLVMINLSVMFIGIKRKAVASLLP